MSYDIEGDVVVDRPPENVWRWTVEDPSREQQWRNLGGNGVQELRRVDDGPVEVGSRFRGSVRIGPGEPQWYVNEVTTLDAPRLVSWETVEADGALGGRGSYRLEPLDEGTRTRFVIQLDYPPRSLVGRLQRPVVVLLGRMVVPRMLRKLKGLVESDPQGR